MGSSRDRRRGSVQTWIPSPLPHGTSAVLISLIKSVCPAELCDFLRPHHTITPITLIPQLGSCSPGALALPALREEIGTVTEGEDLESKSLIFILTAWQPGRQQQQYNNVPGWPAQAWGGSSVRSAWGSANGDLCSTSGKGQQPQDSLDTANRQSHQPSFMSCQPSSRKGAVSPMYLRPRIDSSPLMSFPQRPSGIFAPFLRHTLSQLRVLAEWWAWPQAPDLRDIRI